jgi:hypothetical protein
MLQNDIIGQALVSCLRNTRMNDKLVIPAQARLLVGRPTAGDKPLPIACLSPACR